MAQITAYSIYRIVLVIVGVLIAAALVIGVIVLLHNRGEQVRHDQASQIAEQQVKQQQKSTATTKTATQTASTPTNTATTDTTPVATTPTSAALPVTGPSDSIVPLIAVGLLTFATASYIVSRQRVKAL